MIDNIHAYSIVFVQYDGELDFRADAIDTGDKDGFFIPFDFEKSAEETNIT
jgi:hypothetical protein